MNQRYATMALCNLLKSEGITRALMRMKDAMSILQVCVQERVCYSVIFGVQIIRYRKASIENEGRNIDIASVCARACVKEQSGQRCLLRMKDAILILQVCMCVHV